MPISRRDLARSTLGLIGGGLLAGCTPDQASLDPHSRPVPTAPRPSPSPGQNVVTTTLTPRLATVDLGGPTARTWCYGGTVPGKMLRATAGDFLSIRVENQLPTDTSVHWHGIRLRNAADGVPGVTQSPIAGGTSHLYEFTAPDPGTYFFHPHTGVQLDRGLYAPLIIDDTEEPGAYDAEWIIVLDDWTDGIGDNPDDILAGFKAQGGTVSPGMNHDMGGMGGMGGSPLGDAGDIAYPHYLINGRIPAAPATFTGKPGQRIRVRIINAAADTVFALALDQHTLRITHTDGFPVQPVDTGALYLAMGERYDAVITLGEGVFPLVAVPVGKAGLGRALVRTASGATPAQTVRPEALDGEPLLGTSLRPTEAARLPERSPDAIADVTLNGQMRPYAWGINGRMYGHDTPLAVAPGQRLRMRMTNMTMMVHPMHIHGHTWALPGSGGLRKDTVLVLPMQTVEADLHADNPGAWAFHCHNAYHAETGMMTTLTYA